MSPAYFISVKYSKSHKTGSGHAADSKLRYTIQFSILMLCAKYQEAGLCGSREKCDRNYLVSKVAYVHNIQSRVKNRKWTCCRFKTALHDTVLHTDAMCQISRSWLVWFQRKMWQKIFVTPTPTTTQDDRSDPYMSPPLKRAGDTIT